jgi:hypothetical protein
MMNGWPGFQRISAMLSKTGVEPEAIAKLDVGQMLPAFPTYDLRDIDERWAGLSNHIHLT